MQLIFSKTNKIARARREIIFHNCAEAKRANHLKVFQTLHIFSVKTRTTASDQNNHSLKVSAAANFPHSSRRTIVWRIL